jgi:fluoride exporter
MEPGHPSPPWPMTVTAYQAFIWELMMIQTLVVGFGGFVGAILRYWVSGVVQRSTNSVFPFGTLAVNVLGCLVMGAVMGLVEYRQVFSPHTRVLVTIGMLGGFTTFSTFGFETFMLLRDNEIYPALANVALNVVAGLAAVSLGWFAARAAGV